MNLVALLALVAAGVVFGIVFPHRLTGVVSGATLYVFLPLLLFDAGWNLDYRAIRRFRGAIALLAGPGVVVTAGIIAIALVAVRVPAGSALLAGAILSATDPIAVVALFRRLRVPHGLATIVECESLFNDAVAVMLYRGVLAAASGGVFYAAASGVASSLGGVLLGVAIGFVLAMLSRNRRSSIMQLVASAAGAYGAYFAAERIGASGIFATIAFAITMRYAERSWVTFSVAESVDRAWSAGATIANACVFFLVGAALDAREIFAHPWFAAAALAGVAVARFVLTWMLEPTGFPRAWLAVVRVAGMRGALSLALALTLPAGTPYREAIVVAAFAVALATIAAGSAAAPIVVSRVRRRTA